MTVLSSFRTVLKKLLVEILRVRKMHWKIIIFRKNRVQKGVTKLLRNICASLMWIFIQRVTSIFSLTRWKIRLLLLKHFYSEKKRYAEFSSAVCVWSCFLFLRVSWIFYRCSCWEIFLKSLLVKKLKSFDSTFKTLSLVFKNLKFVR